ncbi:MAG: AraC family transcriptional regulator [Acutalibacteraceae bacterium]|nr:AraC family transcriptional regulator [Acutalibacteraceae bacterium]
MSKYFSYKDKDIFMHYSRDTKPVPSDFRMHTHEYYELYYFEGGSGIYRVEGTPYLLESGDILILRPAEVHYIEISNTQPYTRLAIHFKADLFSDIDPSGKLLAPFNSRKIGTFNRYRADNFKNKDYKVFIKNLISDSADRRVQIITNLLPLLNEISHAFSSVTETEINKSLDSRIINYINRHLYENINLDDICDRFYISKTHLCRIFKKATASTVVEYITIKRLVNARRLILSGTPPTKAYLQCGFRDYSVFYRAYKNKYGVPPSRIADD